MLELRTKQAGMYEELMVLTVLLSLPAASLSALLPFKPLQPLWVGTN